MKTKVVWIFIIILCFSCEKEKNSFIEKYQSICGTWKTKAIYSDSAGFKILKPIRYDRLTIYDNLSYKVYQDSTNLVENGTIEIFSQNHDKLEIRFAPIYPIYSSFAGSHIFVQINGLELITLSPDTLIFKSYESSYYRYPEFHFIRVSF